MAENREPRVEITATHMAAARKCYRDNLLYAITSVEGFSQRRAMETPAVERLLETYVPDVIWEKVAILDHFVNTGRVTLVGSEHRVQILAGILHQDMMPPLYLTTELHPDTLPVAQAWQRLNGGCRDRPDVPSPTSLDALPYVSFLLRELGPETMRALMNGGYLDRLCGDDERLWSPKWVWDHIADVRAWQEAHGAK